MSTLTCIVIPVTWSGVSGDGSSGTLSTTSVQWDATLVKANQFYAENSYSQFQWVFTRVAPVTITAPSLTNQGGLVNEIFPSADAAATAAGHDPTTFDVTVYIVSDGTVFGGDLTTGKIIPAPRRGQCAVKALTMQTATSPGWDSVSHELGHALGIWGLNFDADRPDHFDLTLPHASTLEMPHNAQFNPANLTDPNVVEYGNLFDDMGGGIGGHFHAKAKYELGWMTGRTQTITATGTYTLAALEGAASATQALIVSDGTYKFWIEYRRLVGLESTVSGLQFPAVMIYVVAPLSMNKQGIALLLDMTPSEQPSATDLDPGLPVGTTFSTPNGLTIKTVSMGTTASVTVTLRDSGPQLGIIIFENKSNFLAGTYPNFTASGGGKFASLANTYRFIQAYDGISNPSLPNYCGLLSGSLLGSAGIDTPPGVANGSNSDGWAGSQPNLFAQLQDAGVSWKAYAEDITYWDPAGAGSVKDFYPGDVGWKTAPAQNVAGSESWYVHRHSPGCFFQGPDAITKNPGANPTQGLVDFRTPTGVKTWSQGSGTLLDDMSKSALPDFFFISPNLPHCGHQYVNDAGTTVSGSLSESNAFLSGTSTVGSTDQPFPGVDVLLTKMRAGSTLIVTYDNDGSGTGPIYTCVAGSSYAGLAPWTSGGSVNHYWLLWSIERFFGLGKLGTTNYGGAALSFPQVAGYTGLTNTQVLPFVITPGRSVTPTSVAFPNTNAGSTSPAQTVTVSNDGGATLTGTVSLTGANPGKFAITTSPLTYSLTGGGLAPFNVTFHPAAGDAGGTPFTANLTFTDNATGSPFNVPLSGTVTPVGGNAQVSPTSFSFSVAAGGVSLPQTVRVTNTGGISLTINP